MASSSPSPSWPGQRCVNSFRDCTPCQKLRKGPFSQLFLYASRLIRFLVFGELWSVAEEHMEDKYAMLKLLERKQSEEMPQTHPLVLRHAPKKRGVES